MPSAKTAAEHASDDARRRVSVVGAVIVRDGLVLAARRAEGRRQAGLWEFPGGKVEPGETPAAALRREIAEELGCDVAVAQQVSHAVHDYDGVTVILDTYWCTVVSSSPTALEHAELRWLAVAELPDLDWAPADLATVDALTLEGSGWDGDLGELRGGTPGASEPPHTQQ